MIRKIFIFTLLIGLMFCLFIVVSSQSSYAQKKPTESKKSSPTNKEPAKPKPEVKKEAIAGKETEYRWVNIFPIGTEIHSLAVDPHEANVIYASTYKGLFKSVDGGKLWTPIYLTGELTSSIIKINPVSSKTLYWAVYNEENHHGWFWRSKDGGVNWEDISAGVIGAVNDIAVHPKNSEIMYIVSGSTLYKTLNGGKTWGVIGGKARWLYLNPDLPDKVYVYFEDSGLHRSTNGGQNFDSITPYALDRSEKKRGCYSWYMLFDTEGMIASCLWQFENLWQKEWMSIIKSKDGGKTWEVIDDEQFIEYISERGHEPLFGNEVIDVRGKVKGGNFHSGNKNIIYFVVEGPGEGGRGSLYKILKSTDSGKTWMPLPLPSPYVNIEAIEISPLNSIYITTDHGIFKTADDGATWESASFGLPSKIGGEKTLTGIADKKSLLWVDNSSGDIYVSDTFGREQGYWISSDRGNSWKWSSVKGLRQVIVTNDQTTYIGREVSLSYWEWRLHIDKITPDKGLTEIKIGGAYPKYLAVSPSNSQILYVLASKEKPRNDDHIGGEILLKSEDGGFSWTEIKGPWDKITLLSVDPKSPDIVYAVTNNVGLYFKTLDGGKTWIEIGSRLYQAMHRSMESLRSSSKWLNPKERPDIANILVSSLVTSLVIDPSNSNIIYITTSAGGIYRSDDGGKTWKVKSPLDYLKTLIDAFDDLSAQQCKGRKGCKIMLDITLQKEGKGQLFIPVPPNTVIIYPQKILKERGFSFNNVSIDPSNPGTIYLATGNGVYRSLDRGERWELLNHGLLEPAVRKVIASPSVVLAEGENGIYKLSE